MAAVISTAAERLGLSLEGVNLVAKADACLVALESLGGGGGGESAREAPLPDEQADEEEERRKQAEAMPMAAPTQADWGPGKIKLLVVGEEGAGRWTFMKAIQTIHSAAILTQQRTGFGNTLEIEIKKLSFSLLDGGGPTQSALPLVAPTAIIFLLDSSGAFCRQLSQGQVAGPTREFYQSLIQRYPSASLVAFFNKKDLLEQQHPADWQQHIGRGKEAMNMMAPGKSVYTHVTCATDLTNIKFVFNAVIAMVLEMMVLEMNLQEPPPPGDGGGGCCVLQ